ncbi:hypothetical protein ACWEAF_45050 [Streptomyces sp. NPDC005071]
MIPMWVRRLVLALLAGVALAACTSTADASLADARQACTDMGFENGKSVESDDDSDSLQTAAQWKETADDYDKTANLLARAAREDRRWDSLSNAVTDFQAMMDAAATSEDSSQPQADRDAAKAELDQMDSNATFRVIAQECRKAQAR